MDRSDFVALVAVALLVGVTVAGTPGAAATAEPSAFESQADFDRTEFHITVYENGSARWTFIYRQTLSNDTERQEFETFAQEFNENETTLYRNFQSRAASLVDEGQNVTGREMTARGFSKSAETSGTGVEDNLGEVRMSFLWTGFAQTPDERVVVGDVFQGGLYIGPNQKLVVEQGPTLQITDAQPSPSATSSDSVTWNGERSFNDERPRVVFRPADSTTTTVTTSDATGTSGDATETPGGGDGMSLLSIVALLLVLGLGGGAAYAYRSGRFGNGAAAETSASDGGNGAGGAAATTSSPEPEISDEELLSDDDRVMNMLEERGGRMKQVNIVEETDWSKSKVSMLLSDMEEEGKISKLRVGRENIVSIAGQEPEAAGSPFKDEE